MGFWINLAIPFGVLLYLTMTNKEYVLKEFGIQMGATLVYLVLIYSLLFTTTTNLMDNEYWNSKVKSFTYFEEWTEKVETTESYECGTSKSPKTCSRTKISYDYHYPSYELRTTLNETLKITKKDYISARNKFGSKEVDIYRSGKVSFGDGDKYVSYPNYDIPTSQSHFYENLLKASRK